MFALVKWSVGLYFWRHVPLCLIEHAKCSFFRPEITLLPLATGCPPIHPPPIGFLRRHPPLRGGEATRALAREGGGGWDPAQLPWAAEKTASFPSLVERGRAFLATLTLQKRNSPASHRSHPSLRSEYSGRRRGVPLVLCSLTQQYS